MVVHKFWHLDDTETDSSKVRMLQGMWHKFINEDRHQCIYVTIEAWVRSSKGVSFYEVDLASHSGGRAVKVRCQSRLYP